MTTTDTASRIKGYLRTLKLNRIAGTLDEELARASREAIPGTELLERLLAMEANALTERQIERRIKEAKLPERKLLADFDFVFQTGVDKRQIMDLATLSFAGRRQGLIIAGNSGTGKSHICKALLLVGCQKNFRCRYVTASDMLRELLQVWPITPSTKSSSSFSLPRSCSLMNWGSTDWNSMTPRTPVCFTR